MINNPNNRLGKNGADEIKKYAFFIRVTWDNILNTKPPFFPFLKNEYDTSYFKNLKKKNLFIIKIKINIKEKILNI